MIRSIIILFLTTVCSGVFAQGGNSNAQSFGRDFGNYSLHPLVNGGKINAFNGTDNNTTKGRRYFFDEWVHGSLINASGKKISTDEYYFNFDKVNNNILVTKDKTNIIEVNKDSVNSIHFVDNEVDYNFTKEPKISEFRFVEVLVSNGKVSLYKTINTRLVRANYTTNGITESGNPYDEYIDEPSYVISYKGEFRPVTLKFRAIKKSLKEESDRVTTYYADHLYDEVDETYLKNLVIFVNQ